MLPKLQEWTELPGVKTNKQLPKMCLFCVNRDDGTIPFLTILDTYRGHRLFDKVHQMVEGLMVENPEHNWSLWQLIHQFPNFGTGEDFPKRCIICSKKIPTGLGGEVTYKSLQQHVNQEYHQLLLRMAATGSFDLNSIDDVLKKEEKLFEDAKKDARHKERQQKAEASKTSKVTPTKKRPRDQYYKSIEAPTKIAGITITAGGFKREAIKSKQKIESEEEEEELANSEDDEEEKWLATRRRSLKTENKESSAMGKIPNLNSKFNIFIFFHQFFQSLAKNAKKNFKIKWKHSLFEKQFVWFTCWLTHNQEVAD